MRARIFSRFERVQFLGGGGGTLCPVLTRSLSHDVRGRSLSIASTILVRLTVFSPRRPKSYLKAYALKAPFFLSRSLSRPCLFYQKFEPARFLHWPGFFR